MKRVRCPKCDTFITFDETKYKTGQALVFQCTQCGKQFGIRIGTTKLRNTQKEENPDEEQSDAGFGTIIVIENVFHFKQVIPLSMGDNIIGRYMKGNNINCPIETVDPSVDTAHCAVRVTIGKDGQPKFLLRDVGSQTGTFVQDHLLGLKEQVALSDGDIITIGATTLILQTELSKD